MSIPVSGEQHERAVEAALATPVQGSRGRDVVMQARIRAALDAYHRSLAEQGVRLVDLREVAEYMDHQSWRCAYPPHYYFADGPPTNRGCPCGLDGLMGRFGGNERSE